MGLSSITLDPMWRGGMDSLLSDEVAKFAREDERAKTLKAVRESPC